MTSGSGLLGAQHRFLPVARLPHHLEAVGFREQGADTLAHDGMVVNNQDTNARLLTMRVLLPS